MREYITKEQALRRFADFGREIPKDQVFEVITSLQEEIVRCKDCKFSKRVITSWSTDGKNNAVERLCKVHKWSVKDNDFCSHGERSEE